VWLAGAAFGEELSFLRANPALKAALVQWEQESPPEVQAEIQVLRTGDALAKVRAATRLGKMGDQAKGASLALIEALKDTTAVNARRRERTSAAEEAADALGKMPAAVHALVAALKDTHGGVRGGAARALGGIKDVQAVEPLVAALRDRYTARHAVAALDKIDPEWRKGQATGRAVPGFVAALGDADPEVRHSAVWALGQVRDVRAVEPLIAALRDTDQDVRAAAVRALGEIGDVRAIEPLVAALRDSNRSVRLAAREALGSVPAAVDALLAALRDRDPDVRCNVTWALGEIKDARSMEALVAALGDTEPDVRYGAAMALGQIGDVRAVEPLVAALKDEDRLVRQSAARALGKIKDARAVGPLIGALNDTRWAVCREAGRALEQVDPNWRERDAAKRAVLDLIAALTDTDQDVRYAATVALGEIRDVRALDPLVAALRDPDDLVCRGAAEALGQIGDARAVGPLIDRLRNRDMGYVYVREAAAQALTKITGQGFEKDYDAWVRWWDAQKATSSGAKEK
jgi:HEAT repeat protein